MCGRRATRPPSAQPRATPETQRGHRHAHIAARACTHRRSWALPHPPSVHVPPLLDSVHCPLPRQVLTHCSQPRTQANRSSFCGRGERGQPCQASEVASMFSTWMLSLIHACVCWRAGMRRATPPSPHIASAHSPCPTGPARAMSALLDHSGCPLPCSICPAGSGVARDSHEAGAAAISALWVCGHADGMPLFQPLCAFVCKCAVVLLSE